MYDNLISLYTQYYVVNGKTLNDYRIAVTNVFDSEDQTEINNEINQKRYILQSDRYLANANTRIELLNRQYQYNQTRLDELTKLRDELVLQLGGTTNIEVETYNSQIVSLFNDQKDIEESIDKINKTVEAIKNYDMDAKAEFDAKLDGYCTLLQEQTAIFKDVRIAVYDEKTQVTYKTNKIEPDGGLNIILAAVIGLVLGFVIVSVIICIIDLPKYIKKRDEEAKANALPAPDAEKVKE
jgi:chromosome segregation ATPase